MDRNVTLFLDLVRCRPEDVLDVPPDRLQINHAADDETPHLSDDQLRTSIGEQQIYFGKHKGQKLKDVPKNYLTWALSQEAADKSFRKFQRKARDYLASEHLSSGPSARVA